MLTAELGEKLSGGARPFGSYIFMAFADTFDGGLEVLALPFEIGGQRLIKGSGRVLTVALGVLLQLRGAPA
jgi:hypothetical protein